MACPTHKLVRWAWSRGSGLYPVTPPARGAHCRSQQASAGLLLEPSVLNTGPQRRRG
jgi:hypothetical protein